MLGASWPHALAWPRRSDCWKETSHKQFMIRTIKMSMQRHLWKECMCDKRFWVCRWVVRMSFLQRTLYPFSCTSCIFLSHACHLSPVSPFHIPLLFMHFTDSPLNFPPANPWRLFLLTPASDKPQGRALSHQNVKNVALQETIKRLVSTVTRTQIE